MTFQGLPKDRRLHLKNDFQHIIQGGKRIQGDSLVLWYQPAPDGKTDRRLGIVVSKKLGGAVVRNRAKRLLREAFRLNREQLKSGTDYIFSPRRSEDWTTLAQAENALRKLCGRAGLIEKTSALPGKQDE
ncbi:MAG: ribonuclease P protein component [Elusimicrobiaceae bacterium]|nr:ribonuclease P protein component [Elusimicrobiaceae bacterium]